MPYADSAQRATASSSPAPSFPGPRSPLPAPRASRSPLCSSIGMPSQRATPGRSPRPSFPGAGRPRILRLVAAAVAVALLSVSGTEASRYDSPGPYAVAQTTISIAAAAPGSAGSPFGLGGEEGVLAVHYPAFVAPGTRLPFAYYQHPTHGWQGLTLVHFSAQLERFSWDRGCA